MVWFRLNKGTVFLVSAFFFMVPLFCSAQALTEIEDDADISVPEEQVPDLTVSEVPQSQDDCYGHYRFQSIQASIGTVKSEYAAGEAVAFSGELVNTNPFPVPEVELFVRIHEKGSEYFSNGGNIIDEISYKDIILRADRNAPVNFGWQVPAWLPDGEYRANFFVVSAGAIYFGGLPFTNEVVAGFSDFHVKNQVTQGIFFDRNKTLLNNAAYVHIGDTPEFSADTNVMLQQALTNSLPGKQSVDVRYDLYTWDGLRAQDLLRSTKEVINMTGNTSVDIRYTFPPLAESVYYLKVTAVSDKGVTAILNVRFATSIHKPRLAYIGLEGFVSESQEGVACYQSSTYDAVAGRVVLQASDANGRVIGQGVYQGMLDAAPKLMRIEHLDRITPYVRLRGEVFTEDGRKTHEISMVYDCSELQKTDKDLDCSERVVTLSAEQADPTGSAVLDAWSENGKIVVFVSSIMLILVVVGILVWKWRHASSRIVSVLVFVAIALYGAMDARSVLAYNSRSAAASGSYAYYLDSGFGWRQYHEMNLSVVHKIEMIAGGATVNVGESIVYDYVPDDPFFLRTGGWNTCPYGKWCGVYNGVNGAGAREYGHDVADPATVCFNRERTAAYTPSSNWQAFPWLFSGGWGSRFTTTNTFNSSTPVVYTSSNPAVMSCSGSTCSALAGGAATITATVPQTDFITFVCTRHRNGSNFEFDKDYCTSFGSAVYRYGRRTAFGAAGGLKSPLPSVSMQWDITVTGGAVVDGVCGAAAGGTYASAPITDLCGSGMPSPAMDGGAVWNWSCAGSGGGATANCSAVKLNRVLKICQDTCDSGARRDGSVSTLMISDTRRYVACYNFSNRCDDPSGATLATWSGEAGNTATSFSGLNPAADIIVRADANGTENVTANIGGGVTPVSSTVTVTCVFVAPACPTTSVEAVSLCDTETFSSSYTNTCTGAVVTRLCPGTRYCDTNYKEVSP